MEDNSAKYCPKGVLRINSKDSLPSLKDVRTIECSRPQLSPLISASCGRPCTTPSVILVAELDPIPML